MADGKRTSDAERTTRNRGLEETEKRQRDTDQHTSHGAAGQNAPGQEEPAAPAEKSDEDIAQLENPPQSEGPRERSNNGV